MPDPKADDDREPKGGWPLADDKGYGHVRAGQAAEDARCGLAGRYIVRGSAVGGYPKGTILRRDQLLPYSGSIVRLLELGVISPVPEPGED